MGYWNQTEEGGSLCPTDTGLIWGDTPADYFDLAIDKIIKAFNEDVGRAPSKKEIFAGLNFSIGVLIDDGLITDD